MKRFFDPVLDGKIILHSLCIQITVGIQACIKKKICSCKKSLFPSLIILRGKHIGILPAFESPFISHKFCAQTFAHSNPCTADTVVCVHKTLGLSFYKADLETTEFVFTECLLISKCSNTTSVYFLVVKCKVLRCKDASFLLRFQDLGSSQLSCQDTVLGKILLVSSTVRCTVQVQSWCINGCDIAPQRILRKNISLLRCKIFIEGCRKCRLCRKCSAFIRCILILGRNITWIPGLACFPVSRKCFSTKCIQNSIRSVCITATYQVNGSDRLNTGSTKLDKIACLV